MLEKIQEMIRRAAGSDIEISRETVILSDTGLNSYDLVQLICEAEDEFDVEIPDTALINLKTVGDVMDYITAAR